MAAKSLALEHFHGYREAEKQGNYKVPCKHCDMVIAVSGKTTSNLLTHLKRHHKVIYENLQSVEENQGTISSYFPNKGVKKWQPGDSGKQKQITEAIVTFIAKDMQPLSVVDSKSFRQVLEIAEPRYSMPSRKYMSGKLLSERHTAVHESITSLMQRCVRVCLTLDIWTNRQMRSYLGVTGHCIIDFKLHSVMLACCRFYGAHTGEAIVEAFEEIVHSFSISGKVDTVITDNASNMKRAFRLLNTKGDSSESSETDDDEFIDELVPVDLNLDCDIIPTRFSCLSHTIQLVVKDGLNQGNEVKRVLSKVSKLVTHVHHSTQASALFENEIRLQMANATRWNSQLVMLKSFLRVPEATMDQLDYNGKLNAHERSIIKELIEILTPFQWATDLAQSEKKVTASVIVPIICALRSEMNNLKKKYKSKLVATLSSSVEHRLSTYENEEVFQLAAALDPRWKLAWCTPEKASTLKQVIIDKAKTLCLGTTDIDNDHSSDAPPPKRSKFFEFMNDQPLEDTTASTNTSIQVSTQVQEYFNSPCLPESADPLEFWKTQQFQSKEMTQLACQYLHVPASSAPVERIFSIAGGIFCPDRCRLSDSTFEKLMFIRCNTD